jgi:hypothetical protein
MYDGADIAKERSGKADWRSVGWNFALVAPTSTAAGMASCGQNRRSTEGGTNLYFGTGLSTTKAITRGLPFDFLGMVVGAEFTRRKLGLGKTIHEISDTHAIANGFASAADITCLANNQRALVGKMVKSLKLEGVYECVLASEYQSTSEYQKILAGVKTRRPDEAHYFQYQWAGMDWLASQRNVRVKVGWLTDDTPNPRGFDERRFDRGYDDLSLTPLNYVYLKCGRNVSSTRTRVSPYTSVEGEDRIMLARGEDAFSYFEKWLRPQPLTKDTRQTITHLANIVDGFEKLFGTIKGTDSIWGDPKKDFGTIPSLSSGQQSRPLDVANLAEKINVILTSVFDLRPREPAARLCVGAESRMTL